VHHVTRNYLRINCSFLALIYDISLANSNQTILDTQIELCIRENGVQDYCHVNYNPKNIGCCLPRFKNYQTSPTSNKYDQRCDSHILSTFILDIGICIC
jgi:hypothetical protein